ncbi:MAG: heme lyase CcmF/NrfE family subunit [Luteitalea sp.]|nr:heme lyase CcmF/NrfE family subunit [Luteitalea sp.]
MSSLGTFVLLVTFVTASYAAAASVVGARRRSTRLVESGIGASYLVAALLTVASALIVYAFVVGDYSIRYVQLTSDTAQPLIYKLTAYWGGLDGSVMFWVFLLALFGAIAVRNARDSHRELIPYVVAVIAIVEMFFLFLMMVHTNPFAPFLTETPTEGQGLTPLLQNPYMVIHPPSLYIGFVGMTIPFAFGMAALITGYLDDSWLRAVRRWTMIGWLFLSFGLTLGMIWAYEELGWGGVWGWDPVENAGLLPWITGTAFLHSVMVQERRGMLRVWNVTLVITTFLLTIFGTYMTRSGVVESVHAFGEDPKLAMMFTVFMVLIVTVSFGLVIYRLPLLRSRHDLDSWASREAAFLANNWILLFSALLILFASMFPTLSEAVTGNRLTVGPPFFNKWMLPIGLILLALTGVAPLLAWRKTTLANLRYQLQWSALVGVVTAIGLWIAGVRVWSSGLCFALSGFVITTLVQEFVRGAGVRRATTGSDRFTAAVGLVARNHRRYGGYIVHLGIVLMFLGFAGNGLKQEEQVLLKPGQQVRVGSFTVRHESIRVSQDARKQMVTATMSAWKDGQALGRLYPARWFFHKNENEPTTEVAIRRGVFEDLYVVMAGFEVQAQSATFHVVINPLVNWIWVGFGVLALGTLIAVLPEQVFATALASVPSGAATAPVLLLLLFGSAAPARAQHGGGSTEVTVPGTPLERELRREIVCTCGGCGRQLVADCICSTAAGMRTEIAELVNAGKGREEVYAHFIAKHGSQVPLAMPIDEGFNRLAWAVPYAAGASGLVLIGAAVFLWSRRRDDIAGAGSGTRATGSDEALTRRLEEELRDLD